MSKNQMKAVLRHVIPTPIQTILRTAREQVFHMYYTLRLFGRNASLIPPRKRMFDGTADYTMFKENGEEFLRHYIELCNLRPDEKILDVGSGIGRKTVPLTRYLNDRGRYEGIDIVKTGIEWCRERITAKHPNFVFQQINVYNEYYNPTGSERASQYTFPFDNESFDFVVLGSVFTHLLPEDVDNYLSEVARVLKKGGRCLITFFLLNSESVELIEVGKSTLDLRHDMGMYRVVDPDIPERTIGYDEQSVLALYEKYGLEIKHPIRYGSWCGRSNFLSYQDIIVAFKI